MTEPFTQAAGEKIVLIADEDASGRLDAWIAADLEGHLSRNRIQAMIREGAVLVNRQTVHENRHRIAAGDSVEITMPELQDCLLYTSDAADDSSVVLLAGGGGGG